MTSSDSAWNALLRKLDPQAEANLRELISGAIDTQALYVAAKLGVADQLALGPCSAQTLATILAVNTDALRRVLRFLVSRGVFVESAPATFALNAAAEYLQTRHPRSLRSSAIRAGEGLWQIAAQLCRAVLTGQTPHDQL